MENQIVVGSLEAEWRSTLKPHTPDLLWDAFGSNASEMLPILEEKAKSLAKKIVDAEQRIGDSKEHVLREPAIECVALWAQGEIAKERNGYITELNKTTNLINRFERGNEPPRFKGIDKEDVKATLSLTDFVQSHYGSKLRKIGGGKFSTLCLKHKEKNPSFVIYPDNSTHCFGCGFHTTDCFDLVEKVEEVDFKQALNICAAYV